MTGESPILSENVDSGGQETVPPIHTIGHSNHAWEHFLGLVRQHAIEAVVDTRSYPRSVFAPQFNAETLGPALQGVGIRYIPMGADLGGRPDEEESYDDAGHVLYGRVAESGRFQAAIAKVLAGAARYRIALLCSEEDPYVCHRQLLIGRVLSQRGVEVRHIRGDGRIEIGDGAASRAQASLFDDAEVREWKSLQSVSHRRARRPSSES